MIINTGEKYIIDPDKRYVLDFYTEMVKTLEDNYEPLKKSLLEEMEKMSIDSVETDKLLIIYVAKTDDAEAHLDIRFKSDLINLVSTTVGSKEE